MKKWRTHHNILCAYLGLEPSTALTQSSCKEGSSSLRGTTARMYSISNIVSCNSRKPTVSYQIKMVEKLLSNQLVKATYASLDSFHSSFRKKDLPTWHQIKNGPKINISSRTSHQINFADLWYPKT